MVLVSTQISSKIIFCSLFYFACKLFRLVFDFYLPLRVILMKHLFLILHSEAVSCVWMIMHVAIWIFQAMSLARIWRRKSHLVTPWTPKVDFFGRIGYSTCNSAVQVISLTFLRTSIDRHSLRQRQTIHIKGALMVNSLRVDCFLILDSPLKVTRLSHHHFRFLHLLVNWPIWIFFASSCTQTTNLLLCWIEWILGVSKTVTLVIVKLLWGLCWLTTRILNSRTRMVWSKKMLTKTVTLLYLTFKPKLFQIKWRG